MRNQSNRNKPGGSVQEMMAFNEAISRLGLTEIPLKGAKYTWSNKLQNPLLERIDWFFTSNFWITMCPNTIATTRFENYWLHHEQFQSILEHAWNLSNTENDRAKRLGGKFKSLRRVLREWKKLLPSLAKTIHSCKEALLFFFFEVLEEARDISLQEWNFIEIIRTQLQNFLAQQRIYSKQR